MGRVVIPLSQLFQSLFRLLAVLGGNQEAEKAGALLLELFGTRRSGRAIVKVLHSQF
jgi:hypothetical protein